jgi:very-short-patch-repair endonuclease
LFQRFDIVRASSRGAANSLWGADRLIAEVAEQQHGLIARRQLRERGIGRGGIEARVERGQLHAVHRGVYAVGHRVLSRRARWMAAVLACGPDSVLSHRSAGELWGFLPRFSTLLEVTRARGWRAPVGLIAHQAPLRSDEVGLIDGIPVTSVPRTLFDLAGVLTRRQLERALNEVEVRQLTDRLSIPDLLARYPHKRGAAKLRELLASDEPGGVTDEELEERFVAFLDAHGLPRPRFNAYLALRGRHFKVDCLWRDARLAVELDGRATHGTKKASESDRERDRILLVEGWQSMRITWRQLHDDAPALAVDLRQLLRDRRLPPNL